MFLHVSSFLYLLEASSSIVSSIINFYLIMLSFHMLRINCYKYFGTLGFADTWVALSLLFTNFIFSVRMLNQTQSLRSFKLNKIINELNSSLICNSLSNELGFNLLGRINHLRIYITLQEYQFLGWK